MSDNNGSDFLGGLILGAGIGAFLFVVIATPIYIARKFGFIGISWFLAALNFGLAFIIPLEDGFMSEYCNSGCGIGMHGAQMDSLARIVHQLAQYPWAWIAAGFAILALLLTFFPNPPGVSKESSTEPKKEPPSDKGE